MGVRGSGFLLLDAALHVNGLFPGDRLNTGNIPCGVVCVFVKLTLPCADAGRPAEAVCFQLVPRCFIRLAVKEHLQTVICFVGFHAPAVKFPSRKIGFLMLPHLFNAPTDAANLSVVVGEHIGRVRPALIQMPGLRHFLLQFGDLLRRQTGAALQSLILTEIGIDGFHGFLRRFQLDELGFQLCRCLRVVHDKLDVAAVQLQEFALYQLGRVIVASDAERLSRRADSFQHEVYDLVQTLLVHFRVLRERVILDILHDDFTVNIYGALFERFRSFPFRRSPAR